MKQKLLFLVASLSMVVLTTLPLLTSAADTEISTLTTQLAQTDALTATRGETAVSGKISSEFKTFAGSTSNADALVKGLRSGSPVTLTSTNSQGTIRSTTFTAPTGKMGYGNVFISLSLAQQQLANAGITQPTTQQIRTSLLGGTVTTASRHTVKLSGVAQMRSDGMGWGQIANTLGFKLGPVVSGIKSANANVAAQPVLPTHASAVVAAAGSNSANTLSGIVSGSGASVGASGGNGQGNAYGRGIVSATGGAVGGAGAVSGGGVGHGNAYGQGIVTGAGSNNAGGNSAAHSKGK